MDESVLWAVALGSGVLGLLLLAVGGLAAVYWNAGARRAREAASADKSQSSARGAGLADKSRSPADSPSVRPTTVRSPWAWLRAWVFALVHAGTVSLVLGGITLFDDLAKAGDEIRRTGTVTFPKQLLPGTLFGPASRKHLPQPSGDLLRDGDRRRDDARYGATGDDEFEDLDQPGTSSSGVAGWEVVDLVNGVGVDGDS